MILGVSKGTITSFKLWVARFHGGLSWKAIVGRYFSRGLTIFSFDIRNIVPTHAAFAA